MKTSLYVMTHKKFPEPTDPLYVPLHVGAALHAPLPYISDDTGDNISVKNPNFCELTGLYWVWKNDPESDVVGLCHYRRFFVDENGKKLGLEFVNAALKKYDVIMTPQFVLKSGTLWEHYVSEHHEQDLVVLRSAIEKLYPEYLAAFDEVMGGSRSYFANMFITRKSLADEYCKWLFDILFETEKNLDISGYDAYNSRVFGFLSERMLTVWLHKRGLRIWEQDVEELSPRWELYDGLDEILKTGDTAKIYDCLAQRRELAVRIINEGHDYGNRIRSLYTLVEAAHRGGDMPLSYELLHGYIDDPG